MIRVIACLLIIFDISLGLHVSIFNRRDSTSVATNTIQRNSLSSPDRSEDVTAQTMGHISRRFMNAEGRIVNGLRSQGWAVVDDFLQDNSLSSAMRAEAVRYYEAGDMVVSQSTRFDPTTQGLITYDKHNVFSMQLMGGDLYYRGPRLHEYCVAMVKALVPVLSRAFPEINLSSTMVSNKLAVCVGDGSAYDKHYDNSGLSDLRKVTALYYMNFSWKPENGGCFRIYNPSGSVSETTDIEPVGDRLLVFWSDRLVHSVEPSFAPEGKEGHRYALTLWMTSESPDDIARDDIEIARHFGALQRKP
jgi:hypothetical protein